MYLDTMAPLSVKVGYGALGLSGGLGYENKHVSVQRRPCSHALSTHPPAHLQFDLGGRFAGFHCQVAINDDVPAGISWADFTVLADGREVVTVPHVIAGEPPRPLNADIAGAQVLDLVVRTHRWEYCHAVWLNPQVDGVPRGSNAGTLIDCLGRTEIVLPDVPLRADHCVATVASNGWAKLLDDMLGSLHANSGCLDALVVVFGVDADTECQRVAGKYGATFIPCKRLAKVNATIKSVLYTVPRVIDADRFLCLDADMLILGDLRPIFYALDAFPVGSILACREANERGLHDLNQAITDVYGGRPSDLARLLGSPNGEGGYSLVVNDGTFAGSRTALLALDSLVRGWTQAPGWVDERGDILWRNQFIFNLALAHLDCGVELDPVCNIQLHFQDVELQREEGQVQGRWHGRPIRVLHFNGYGRHKYPDFRGLHAQLPLEHS